MKRFFTALLITLCGFSLFAFSKDSITEEIIHVIVEQGSQYSNNTQFYTDRVEAQAFDLCEEDLQSFGSYEFQLDSKHKLVIQVVEPLEINFLSNNVYYSDKVYYTDINSSNASNIELSFHDNGSKTNVCVSATHIHTNLEHLYCEELNLIRLDQDYIYEDNYSYASYSSEQELIEDFLSQKGSDEDYLSIYYENLMTSSTYELNSLSERFGASTQKILIAQYYYNLLDEESMMAKKYGNPFEFNLQTLKSLLDGMIVYSDNEATDILLSYINYEALQEFMSSCYKDLYSSEAFYQNLLSAKLLKEVFNELRSDPMKYKELWVNLGLASKEYQFAIDLEHVDVYHKYGTYGDSVNDAGIIVAPEPFMLIVLSENYSLSEQDLGELARSLYEYQVFTIVNKEGYYADLRY